MTKNAPKIRFKAKLLRSAATAKLPTRGMTTVNGTLDGFPFRATLEPDGQRSHWLKVDKKTREAAGADVGDIVTLEIVPTGDEPEPRVRADLRKALAAARGFLRSVFRWVHSAA